jgi:hypothetical protein
MKTAQDVADRIKNNEQIVFVKYGDGETQCMLGYPGANCDSDPYTPALGAALRSSLRFYIEHKGCYVGRWHDGAFITPVIEQLGMGEPTWAPYHLVMNADAMYEHPHMHSFLETVQQTPRRKIVVSNGANAYMKPLFRADAFVEVPPCNWFVDFDSYFEQVKREVTDDCIVFTSAGQGSKVLIAELLRVCPGISCVDIGSSFDFICQRRVTRDRYMHNYDRELAYYADLLP